MIFYPCVGVSSLFLSPVLQSVWRVVGADAGSWKNNEWTAVERDSDSRGPITRDKITLQKSTRKISLDKYNSSGRFTNSIDLSIQKKSESGLDVSSGINGNRAVHIETILSNWKRKGSCPQRYRSVHEDTEPSTRKQSCFTKKQGLFHKETVADWHVHCLEQLYIASPFK